MYLEAEMSGSIASVDRLSPPSSLSISRLSDSDISELDFDEGLSRRGNNLEYTILVLYRKT